MEFYRIGVDVIKFPRLVLGADELPAADADRAVALVFPREQLAWQRFVGKGRQQARPLERRDRVVADFRWIRRAAQRDAGGHDVDQVARLVAEFSTCSDARGPVCDQRRADAPFVAVVLVEPKRRVAGIGPAAAVAVICFGVSHRGQIIAPMECVLGSAALVEAKWIPLSASAVVAEEQDQCVVEFAALAQVIDDAADVAIHARDHPGVDRHPSCQVRAAIFVERVPSGVHAGALKVLARLVRTQRRKRRFLANESQLDLPRVPLLAQFVPADLVRRGILRDIVGLSVQRKVRRVERQVLKPRLLRFACLGKKVERVIAKRIAAVERVFGVGSLRAIRGQARVERVFLKERIEAADHAIEFVEAAVRRPRRLGAGAEMPLANHRRVIAGVTQHLGDRACVGLRKSAVAGGRCLIGHRADTRLMRVEAGQQTRAAGAAACAVVELAKAQAVFRQGIDIRRRDLAAVTTDVGIAKVIGKDYNDVRSACIFSAIRCKTWVIRH